MKLFSKNFVFQEIEGTLFQQGLFTHTPFAISLFDPTLGEFDFHTMLGIQVCFNKFFARTELIFY